MMTPETSGPGDTGHEWDGIRELNNPLPRWWLYIFLATIVFAAVYVVLYPAIPGRTTSSRGTLGYSSRGANEAEMASIAAARAPKIAMLTALPIADLPRHPDLERFAVEGGKAAFKLHCAACHGSGAQGGHGYPNLNDDDWLWGGSLETVEQTITHGIRYPGDDSTRQSAMPAFGRDGILTPPQVDMAVEYVRKISGQDYEPARAMGGAKVFAENCAACHGPDGKGNREFGAPNLTDKIWLYGGDREALRYTVTNARNSVMPAWGKQLDPGTIRQLAIYVHSLGGGEQ